ncbi:Mobile element protein [hydrothermal vent metagenome]|uniref:Mobile element protein n=1 Tax=hydrothermal vent metagenome TaxID=652676 RepID=A0A3B1A1Y8_9ZZZZ
MCTCTAWYRQAETVVGYLSRYSHKIAISDSRIEAIQGETVSLHYKDYKRDGQRKTLTLNGEELIRRFLQHVLPKGFMRIRHFGFLANRCRETKLEQIRQALKVPASNEQEGDKKNQSGEKATFCTEVSPCPRCHQRQWRAVALIAPKRFKGG